MAYESERDRELNEQHARDRDIREKIGRLRTRIDTIPNPQTRGVLLGILDLLADEL
jgi:hypothetical protein